MYAACVILALSQGRRLLEKGETLANEITLTSKVDGATIAIRNGALQVETNRIFGALEDAKNSLFVVAYTMNKINTGKLYAADGFKDIYDYGDVVFGYKRAMVNNLCRVGANYLVSDNGTIKSLLAHNDDDYSVSQIQEVLPISVEDAKTLDKTGAINPNMTTKEIRTAVKSFRDSKGNDDDTTKAVKAVTANQIRAAIDKVYSVAAIVLDAATDDEKAAVESALDMWGSAAAVVVTRVEDEIAQAKAAAKAAKAAEPEAERTIKAAAK